MQRTTTRTIKKTQLLLGKYDALSVAKYLLSLDPKREYFTLN